MKTSHWVQQLGLRQTDTGELVAILDPAESRARSRRVREKSVPPSQPTSSPPLPAALTKMPVQQQMPLTAAWRPAVTASTVML